MWFDGLNRFYIAGEHMGGLVRHFQLPLNLFDDFVRHDPEVASHLADARSASATAQAEIVTMGEQLSQTVGERDHAIALNGQQLVELLQLAEECSQQSINAQCLREDYERQLERAESETAALNQTIATMRSGGAVMGNKLEQIALELKWADGPRAIKVVLPAARLLRRLNRIASRADQSRYRHSSGFLRIPIFPTEGNPQLGVRTMARVVREIPLFDGTGESGVPV